MVKGLCREEKIKGRKKKAQYAEVGFDIKDLTFCTFEGSYAQNQATCAPIYVYRRVEGVRNLSPESGLESSFSLISMISRRN